MSNYLVRFWIYDRLWIASCHLLKLARLALKSAEGVALRIGALRARAECNLRESRLTPEQRTEEERVRQRHEAEYQAFLAAEETRAREAEIPKSELVLEYCRAEVAKWPLADAGISQTAIQKIAGECAVERSVVRNVIKGASVNAAVDAHIREALAKQHAMLLTFPEGYDRVFDGRKRRKITLPEHLAYPREILIAQPSPIRSATRKQKETAA